MELTLDKHHVYMVDGQVVDGLTSTLKEAGLIRASAGWYAERGTRIHRMTEEYDLGILSEADADIKPYLASWIRFRDDTGITFCATEEMMYHPILQVATTIDRLPGPIDIKSGSREPWHILQVAFQVDLLRVVGLADLATKPADVYLDPAGGPPKVIWYSPREIREAIRAYHSLIHWLRWKRGAK